LNSRRALNGHEILSIADDPSSKKHHRVALTTRGGDYMIADIDKNGNLNPTVLQAGYGIPKTIAFTEDGESICLFGLYDGKMCVKGISDCASLTIKLVILSGPATGS
jgi:hypothetical protein